MWDLEKEGHIWKGRKISELRVNRDDTGKKSFQIQRVTIPQNQNVSIVKSGGLGFFLIFFGCFFNKK